MCPMVSKLTDNRRASIRARWRNELPTLQAWDDYFAAAAESRFLTGRTNPGPGRERPFVATLDFLIRPSTVVRLMEGAYDD